MGKCPIICFLVGLLWWWVSGLVFDTLIGAVSVIEAQNLRARASE